VVIGKPNGDNIRQRIERLPGVEFVFYEARLMVNRSIHKVSIPLALNFDINHRFVIGDSLYIQSCGLAVFPLFFVLRIDQRDAFYGRLSLQNGVQQTHQDPLMALCAK
jgi:hypothetical protein